MSDFIIPDRRGLVAEYILNGDTKDTSGNGYNGTPLNVTYSITDRGYQRYAGNFNGSSSEISVASSPNLSVSSAYTFNVVCYFSALPSSGSLYSILNKRETSASAGYELELWNDGGVQKVFVSHADSGGADTYLINYALPTGRPFLLTVTYDGSTVTFMVDGETVGSVTGATRNPSASNSGVFRMGRNAYSGARWLSGRIQSVRIFNRALSETEIRNWYLESLRALGGSTLSDLMSGIVAYYDFRGDANDIVGGNDGTVSGATLTTDRFGNANSAYNFVSGSSQYVSLPSTAFSAGGTNVFHCRAVVKFNDTSGNRGIVMGTTTGTGILLYYSGGALVFSKPNVSDLIVTTTLSTSVHSHIDAVADASGMRLYLNGSLIGSNANTANFSNTTSAFALGGYMNGGVIQSGWYLDGKIDEAFFQNKAPSADEIKSLYELSSKSKLLPFE